MLLYIENNYIVVRNQIDHWSSFKNSHANEKAFTFNSINKFRRRCNVSYIF